jgi:hypothetical protein
LYVRQPGRFFLKQNKTKKWNSIFTTIYMPCKFLHLSKKSGSLLNELILNIKIFHKDRLDTTTEAMHPTASAILLPIMAMPGLRPILLT